MGTSVKTHVTIRPQRILYYVNMKYYRSVQFITNMYIGELSCCSIEEMIQDYSQATRLVCSTKIGKLCIYSYLQIKQGKIIE